MCQALMERDRRAREKGRQELLQSQIDKGTITIEEAIEYGYIPQEDATGILH